MIKIRAIRYLLGAATACGNGDPKIPVTGFGPVHSVNLLRLRLELQE